MTFSQKILTAHTALMRAALVSWNYKILWLQYLLIPVLATALVISATVNCTIRELLTQNLGFCRLLPPHTDSFFQIILVLLWLFFSAAFLRQVYAIMNGAPLTFKKSFSFGWWFVGQLIIATIIKSLPYIFSFIGKIVPQWSSLNFFTLSTTSYTTAAVGVFWMLAAAVWYTGTFYIVAIMTENLSGWLSAFKNSWKLAWHFLLTTLASIVLISTYIFCITLFTVLIVGSISWILFKLGVTLWIALAILILLFGAPCITTALWVLCWSLAYTAILYRILKTSASM